MRGVTAPTPRRRCLRFAIVAVVCLFLGAATTVGVAWRIAWTLPVAPNQRQLELTGTQASSAGWPDAVPIDWPPPIGRTMVWCPGWEQDHAWARTDEHLLCVRRFGWPFRALRLEVPQWGPERVPRSTPRGWRREAWSTGLMWSKAQPWPQARHHSLPCVIVWPGWFADTVVFASAWGLLLFARPAYCTGRRRFRVSRGLCLVCGYDLKGSALGPCPECGTFAGEER
jgi:hypothetical protein